MQQWRYNSSCIVLTLMLYGGGWSASPSDRFITGKDVTISNRWAGGGGANSHYGPWWECENTAVADKEFSYPRSRDSGVVTMATELLWFFRSLCYTSWRTDGQLTRSTSKAYDRKHFSQQHFAMYQSALCHKPEYRSKVSKRRANLGPAMQE
jgi:hypothetical protein